jgi:DNA-binding NarL/FixJ family response regulator
MRDDGRVGNGGPNATQRPIRVFVMSDHPVVRAGMTMFICPESDLDLVGEGGADGGALPLLRACAPDVVIVDLDKASGAELLAAVVDAVPSARLLVLAEARDVGRHHMPLPRGMVRFLLKEASLQVVLTALRRCQDEQPPSSGCWYAAGAAGSAISLARAADVHERRIAQLSERERKIVTLIGEGLRNDQVAARLGVAEKTVRNQLSSLFDKLGVNDRLGLAVYAFEHGLLHPPS